MFYHSYFIFIIHSFLIPFHFLYLNQILSINLLFHFLWGYSPSRLAPNFNLTFHSEHLPSHTHIVYIWADTYTYQLHRFVDAFYAYPARQL